MEWRFHTSAIIERFSFKGVGTNPFSSIPLTKSYYQYSNENATKDRGFNKLKLNRILVINTLDTSE